MIPKLLKNRANKVSAALLKSLLSTKVSYPPSWVSLATKELGGSGPEKLHWQSPEGIVIKPLYTPADLEPTTNPNELEAPGVYPFKRGPYATMYTAKP